jgi:spermidine synthase
MRLLQVNEGFDSFQSVWIPRPGLLPDGYYYDYFALPPALAPSAGPWRLLVLGLGAGTAWRVLEGALPDGLSLVAHGVEIDATAVALGRRHFDLASGPARTILAGRDARAALVGLKGPFDEVVLDAYANQMEIPAHLSTREFFREVLARLASGGWLAVNVGGFGLEDPVVEALAATVAAAFERPVLAVRVPFSRNAVLFARRDADPILPGDEAWSRARGPAAALLGRLELPGAVRLVRPGAGRVLTDDHNPIEWLQQRSVRDARMRLEGAP